MHNFDDFLNLIPSSIENLAAQAIPGFQFGLTNHTADLTNEPVNRPIKSCRRNVYMLDLRYEEQHIRLLFSMDHSGWSVSSPVKTVDKSRCYFGTRSGSLYHVPEILMNFPEDDPGSMLCLISALEWHNILHLFRLPEKLTSAIHP